MLQSVGEVVADGEEDCDVDSVPVTVPDKLALTLPLELALLDPERVPLTVPVKEAVPQEDAEGEALADIDRVPDTEVQPDTLPERVGLSLPEALPLTD